MQTVEFQKKIYVIEPGVGVPAEAIDPTTLSSAEQVTLYNLLSENMGQSRIKAFHDRMSGGKRIVARLTEWANDDGDADEPTVAKPTPEPDAKPKAVVRNKKKPAAPKPAGEKKQRKSVNFLGMYSDIKGSGDITPLKRENTTMALLYPELTKAKGATFEELAAVFAKVDKERGRKSKRDVRIRIYEAIRAFCYGRGYSTVSTPTTIKIVE
jgi:hypothetical protein